MVEWRRNAVMIDGSCLLDLFEVATEDESRLDLGVRSNLEEVVLLRLKLGRAGSGAARRSSTGPASTCDMLSSGVTSKSSELGKLRRFGFEWLDALV